MKNIDSLFNEMGGDNQENIINLITELKDLDFSFDIRFVQDMENSLILDKIRKIAEKLKLKNAITELNEIETELKLLTFAHKRKELFNSESTEINIMSSGLNKIIDMELLVKTVFGWDKIGNNKV